MAEQKTAGPFPQTPHDCGWLLNTVDPSQPEFQWVMPDGSRVEAVPPPFPLPPGVRPLPPSPKLDQDARATAQSGSATRSPYTGIDRSLVPVSPDPRSTVMCEEVDPPYPDISVTPENTVTCEEVDPSEFWPRRPREGGRGREWRRPRE